MPSGNPEQQPLSCLEKNAHSYVKMVSPALMEEIIRVYLRFVYYVRPRLPDGIFSNPKSQFG
jgi:hypothetical protein